MAGSTNLVVPLVMWGKSSPGHCVSCVYLLRDQRTMVTGSHDGQLIIWQLENTDQWNFTPRHMLIGHTGAVRSVFHLQFWSLIFPPLTDVSPKRLPVSTVIT